MAKLKPERADEYQTWLEVGMALRGLGDAGLLLWDGWSKKSAKYRAGECARKWETFTAGERGDIGLGSLLRWADEDGSGRVIPRCPPHAKASHYLRALEALGYTFSINRMNDDVLINGLGKFDLFKRDKEESSIRQSDITRAVLLTELNEYGYNQTSVAERAWYFEAAKHPFHPIQDYLDGLAWDGEDHIAALCGYFDGGRNKPFNTFIRRWLIGAVARAMAGEDGTQSRVLVLDGAQDIGKSTFVRWLGSPLPAFYTENAVNPDDKDFLVYLCSTWIWEVPELGSTMRRSDLEALKHFWSRQTVKVRKAYGRDEIIKPAISAFIATINNVGGFLWDPTGYRRFMVANVGSIDWDYSKVLDINQLWAQAVHLYRTGEHWELTAEEKVMSEEICQEYEVEDTLRFYILKLYRFDPRLQEPAVPVAEIIRLLQDERAVQGEANVARRITPILKKEGAKQSTMNLNGRRVRAWRGLERVTKQVSSEPGQMVLPDHRPGGTPVDLADPGRKGWNAGSV